MIENGSGFENLCVPYLCNVVFLDLPMYPIMFFVSGVLELKVCCVSCNTGLHMTIDVVIL